MAIQDEPSFIDGKTNPIFGLVNLHKSSEMKVEHDYNHEHFWDVNIVYENGNTDVQCSCGKGKTLGKDLMVMDGKIVPCK